MKYKFTLIESNDSILTETMKKSTIVKTNECRF